MSSDRVWPTFRKVFIASVFGVGVFLIPNGAQSATNHSVILQWAANQESDLAGYRVYQGATSGSYGPAVDVGNTTIYTAQNLQAELTYYFVATAYDSSGNESFPSIEESILISAPPTDTTSPSVSLTAPSNGSTVSGMVTLAATATDNIGVVGVQFQLNGTNLGAEETTNPFSVSWDTTGVAPGQYTLTAIARDAAGNTTSSDPVLVTLAASPSTLSVSVVGSGTVTSSPTGILCTQGTCSASFGVGSTVALIAKADKKWKFAGWSGACSGTGECVIQLSTDQFVGATFSKNGNGAGKGRGRKK